MYFQTPNTAEEWRRIAKEFEDCWGFPNCVGAMDGKHIGFRPLRKDAVLYYNYKGFHSIVLLALVDAQKKFLAVDVGVNGRISDGGVLSRSKLNTALLNNELNFPPPEPLPGRRIKVPFVIVADNAFPLRINLIKPYIFKSLSKMQIHFNKCLSRARNVVENAFGILANRFRVLLGLIESQDPHFVELVTLVCCILHNFLIEEDPNRYLGSNAEEDENEEPAELVPLEPIDARNDSGIKVRLEYLKYCNKVPLFYWKTIMFHKHLKYFTSRNISLGTCYYWIYNGSCWHTINILLTFLILTCPLLKLCFMNFPLFSTDFSLAYVLILSFTLTDKILKFLMITTEKYVK